MSWSTVPGVSSTFSQIASVADAYVEFGYCVDDYILAESIWADVAAVSPDWTVA